MKQETIVLLLSFAIVLGCANSAEDDNINSEKSKLAVSNVELNFPDTGKFEESVDTIVISNIGKKAINITNILTVDNFEITFADIELDNSIIIETNSSIEVYITFKPTEVKSYSGTLTILNDSESHPELEIDLTGSGLPITLSKERINIYNQNDVDSLSKYDRLIADDFVVWGRVNDTLLDFKALSNTEIYTYYLIIGGSFKKTPTFDDLSNINMSVLSIQYTQNNDLTPYKELFQENLRLQIEFNDNLNDLSALSSVNSLNSIVILGNPKLTNLSGLDSLDIKQSIFISENIDLEDFCAIAKIAYNSISTVISYNKYNPKKIDFENGRCKQN